MQKIPAIIPTDAATVQSLQTALGISPLLCHLLVQRGVTTYDQAKQFFRPNLADLHDPFLMLGMEKAVARIELAIRNKERILLYGDYDVDGTTSVATLFAFLENHYTNIDYYIPDRYKEGYGVSMAGIDYAKQNGVKLIIAMDCGIKAIKQVAAAKEMGIDFIICDHHLPAEKMPDAVAILDPKQNDCKYPYKELSGCGVTFKLIQAYASRNNIPIHEVYDLLDFLVISIAADIVPMTGENRTLAHFGLLKLNRTPRPGLKALIQKSQRTQPFAISDIVFGIAPLINAAGRLADAASAVRLLLSKEKFVAHEYAKVLEQRNKLRKEFDRKVADEATELFHDLPDWETRKSIVLYQPDWHKGIIGIAASRLVDTFHRPTIILTESNGQIVGSARSVRGFNVHDAIEECKEYLVNFGGHAYAAGMTLKDEAQVALFKEKFEENVRNRITDKQLAPTISINAEINFEDITPKFWRILKQFAPFGPSNRSPIFLTKNVRDSGTSRVLKGDHLKLYLKQHDEIVMNGIGFGMGDYFPYLKEKQPFDMAYKLEENTWKGKNKLEFMARELWFESKNKL